ncbi:MAG: RluA family pseudouridine synthase [Rhodospirillales bacterium]
MSPAHAETAAVDADEDGMRLDRWFKARYPALGHGRLQKMLRTGQVRVDGKRVKGGERLHPGQQVRVPPFSHAPPASAAGSKSARTAEVSPEDAEMIQACVLHRDDDVLVINKPAGLAVQGGSGQRRHLDALLDALRFEAQERPRLVHRLDKDTSGVLLLARSRLAAMKLTAAFRTHDARKLYWALVTPPPTPPEGRITLALAKRPAGSAGEKVIVDAVAGQRAVSIYRTIAKAGNVAWAALEPLTGRTHQLRAHMNEIGAPVLGDGKYGGAEAHIGGDLAGVRLQLHARRICIPNPAGGVLDVSAPPPDHMRDAFAALGLDEDLAQNNSTASNLFDEE